MITVLGLYASLKDKKPTFENITEIEKTFETKNWEFNCYSRDTVIVSEHQNADQKLHNKLQLYASWQPRDQAKVIASGIQNYHHELLDQDFYKLVGLKVERQDRHIHSAYIKTLYKDFQCFSDTIGQIAALPHGVENSSAIIFNKGLNFDLPHDPWRYFKILKVNETVRKQEGFKTTGGDGQREPINSSNILFCENINRFTKQCIGHYHLLYTMSRPIVLQNLLKYQLRPAYTTINRVDMNINNLLAKHLNITVVPYHAFETFEKWFWDKHDNETNKAEYNHNDKYNNASY